MSHFKTQALLFIHMMEAVAQAQNLAPKPAPKITELKPCDECDTLASAKELTYDGNGCKLCNKCSEPTLEECARAHREQSTEEAVAVIRRYEVATNTQVLECDCCSGSGAVTEYGDGFDTASDCNQCDGIGLIAIEQEEVRPERLFDGDGQPANWRI